MVKAPCLASPPSLTTPPLDLNCRRAHRTGAVDLVIAQDHCRVCAITPGDISSSSSCSNVAQLILKPSNLDDCFEDVLSVARALGVEPRGKALVSTLRSRLERVTELSTRQRGGGMEQEEKAFKPRVALLEWCAPVMGCGCESRSIYCILSRLVYRLVASLSSCPLCCCATRLYSLDQCDSRLLTRM